MSKPRGKPFEPGNRFGRGRPKGSRNRDGAKSENLLDEWAPHLLRKVIELAMKGNFSALRMLLERTNPAPRDGRVSVKLPKIKSAADLAHAAERITRAVGKGVLSPSQGDTTMRMLESHSRVIDRAQTEDEIRKLEDLVKAGEETR